MRMGRGNGVLVPTPVDEAESARGRLEEVRPADPTVTVGHRLAEGIPAEEILKVAAALPADLMVMGTHGWSGLGRLLVGSIAGKVMRKAPCPALTVKAPAPAHTDSPAGNQPVTV